MERRQGEKTAAGRRVLVSTRRVPPTLEESAEADGQQPHSMRSPPVRVFARSADRTATRLRISVVMTLSREAATSHPRTGEEERR